VVVVGEMRYRAVGVEAMNYSLMFGGRSSVHRLQDQIKEYRASCADNTGGAVGSKLVRPSVYELALLPMWLIILLAIWLR
jgi:hypothetical protein